MSAGRPLPAGIYSTLELGMRFAQWMEGHPRCTPQSVMRAWEVSQATANRWLAAYRNFQGFKGVQS